jgi:dihydrofolate reductase
MQDRSEEVDLAGVIFDMSVSLDGFVRASNATPEQPLGDGGERLHEWAFGGDERDREVLARGVQGSGAIIAGRRTYDDSVPFWGADGPHPPTRVFVVTHEAPAESPEGGVYTFVTDGIESALEQAKVAAGDKNVHVMGGPDTGRQFIEARLVDEIGVHLVPVLFGSGTRMFEHLGSEHIQLETLGVIETSAATHLRYRIVK